MTLTPLDIVNGVFGLVFVFISIVLGLIITLKYFQNNDINFIYIGLTWVFITSGWWGTSFSFLQALVTGGEGLSFAMILLLNFIPLPFGLIFWLIGFSNFFYKDKQKSIILTVILISLIFYILFFAFLIIDPSLIGQKISPVDTSGENVVLLSYLVLFILIFLITGIIFANKTRIIDSPETRLKGWLLLIAFPSFAIGGFLDSMITSTALTLILFRSILILSALEFYSAFMLPSWIKKIFLKGE